jgi:hypothetical protein
MGDGLLASFARRTSKLLRARAVASGAVTRAFLPLDELRAAIDSEPRDPEAVIELDVDMCSIVAVLVVHDLESVLARLQREGRKSQS